MQLKDIGEARFLFIRFLSNAAWLRLMLVAALRLVAAQRLLLDGDLAIAEPRRLRHTLLHTAARIVRRSARPGYGFRQLAWTPQLLAAFHRLDALVPAPG